LEVKEPSAKYLARPEFKQTELGLVPGDWEIAALSAITDCLDNLRVPLNESQRARRQGEIPYCGANGVVDYIDDSVIDDDIILMAEDGGYFDEYRTRPIAYRMKGKCWVNNHAHILKAKAGVDQGFIYYSLVHKNILPFLASGTRAKLNRSELNKIEVALPPTIAEQETIAEALSDADALIESLEQLLAKKRQLKEGAMQEFLTGRRRLSGFGREPGHKQRTERALPADWDTGPIGRAIERLEAGASVNSDRDEAPEFESYPCVLKTGAASGGSFDPRESKKVTERDLWRLKVSVRKDTILISRMNTVELVGESGYVPCDYPNLFVPDRMWMATVRSRVSPQWLSYILTWRPVRSQISASATGTSGSMKNISKPSFRAVEIPYPPIEEQRAIAAALSDMDAEITALAARVAKDRQVKQGMMQALLTGRIRLL
jgi:type I restriction enzyme S subunit